MRVRLFWIHVLAGACCICHVASAQTDKELDLLDMNLETLLTIKVEPSADASAKGLSTPYAGGQIARGGRIGILSTLDIMETPFSVTNYTQEFIKNHQAASVGDVLQYDPAVRVARGFGNFQQVYKVRGLPIFSDDMTYNGLYGILPRQYLAAELIERVEVLRGANTILNGAAPSFSGNIGGAIDVIPKRAPKEDLSELTLGFESANQSYLATDLARRFADGDFGLRINAVDTSGDTQVENESRHLDMATIGADYRGTNFRISADLGYQDHKMNATQPSVTAGAGLLIPTPPDADKSITQAWTYSNERDQFGTFRTEYDLNNHITGWLAYGTRQGKEHSLLSAFMNIYNNAGDYTASPFEVGHEDAIHTGELGLKAIFTTQEIHHHVTISANHYNNDSRNAYSIRASFSGNFYHAAELAPSEELVFAGGNLDHPLVTASVNTTSIAATDELGLFDDKLLLTLGARRQSIQETDFNYDSGTKVSNYDANRTTPAFAALYKLSTQYSLYGSYLEGLSKGDIAPATSELGPVKNAGESLQPYKTQQHEVGLKFDAKQWGATAAVYQLKKPLTGFSSDNRFSEQDFQQITGIETSIYGELGANTRILGGANMLNSETQSKQSIGTPHLQANIGLEWKISQVPGLTLTSQMMYTGTQYVDTNNDRQIPSWTRFDIGARYNSTAWNSLPLTLRVSIENITNESHWTSVGGFPNSNYLTLGNPRTLLISATIRM